MNECSASAQRMFAGLLAASLLFTAGVQAADLFKLPVPNTGRLVGGKAGQQRRDNNLKMAFAWCPPGKFVMGSPEAVDPKRRAEVTLTRGFWLGKYEVTQQEYERIMGDNPSFHQGRGAGGLLLDERDTSRFPVEQVTWHDAQEFCRRLTEKERKAGRLPKDWSYQLPTDAQWEYACRAGTTTKYAFGDSVSDRDVRAAARAGTFIAPKGVSLSLTTTAVGSYRANAWGLFDMHGNAWEWCLDGSGKRQSVVDPVRPMHDDYPEWRMCRSAGSECNEYRCDSAWGSAHSGLRGYQFLGFRVALVQTGM